MPQVTYESHDGIALVTICRPDRKNALNGAVAEGLADAWQRLQSSDDRAAVLAARGSDFSVGADINDVPAAFWKSVPGVGVDLDKPIVAAVQGWCVGGAVAVVQMCDLCVAEPDAKFYYPEAKLGLTAGLITAVVERMPHKIAMEFMLVGDPMPAQRAYEIGFINRVAAAGMALEDAMQYARKLAANAPLVVRTLKRQALATLPRSPLEDYYRLKGALDQIAASDDFKEGVAAFKQKRKPRFAGR